MSTTPSLLTVAEYLVLGETELGYYELVEGRVVLSPTPDVHHAHVLVGAMLSSPRSCRPR